MAKITVSATLRIAADSLWNLVGDFNGMADWHPAFARSDLEEGGKRRRLTLTDGGSVYEQLESRDDAQRTYSYSTIEGPPEVEKFLSRVAVLDAGDGRSTIVWAAQFSCQNAEAQMVEVYQDFFEAGFQNIRMIFGIEEEEAPEEEEEE